jgi:subtilase family serine protease
MRATTKTAFQPTERTPFPTTRARGAVIAASTLIGLLALTGCHGSPAPSSSATSDLLAFTHCMRAHGISDYPDPGPQDKAMLRTHPDLNPNNPQFKAALRACGSPVPTSTTTTGRSTSATVGDSADCDSLSTCYSPRQFQRAYGVSPLVEQGIDGRGETVVLPELAEPRFPLPASDIRQDLAEFDKLFHLPAASLRSVSILAPSASPWLANGEEVLDTEMVHAIAPAANIVELLVPASSLDNAAAAVTASTAAVRLSGSLGDVISISAAGQTGGEHCDTPSQVAALHAALQTAAAHHVTVIAASGDIGAVGEPCHVIEGLIGGIFPHPTEVNLPAADPLVLAAGGTTLTTTPSSGAYLSETAWGVPYGDPGSHFQASGGGFSKVVARPSYQAGLTTITAHRGVPDVAADASPHTGMAIVTSTTGGQYSIHGSGGTSATAPMWAGLIALADQYAGRHLGFVNAAIYRIGHSSPYRRAFHDVTSGDNSTTFPPNTISGYQAKPGWDPVTGWGTPNAGVLVPMLARDVRPNDAQGL